MSIASTLRALNAISSAQWGLLTTAQAEQQGISRLQLGRLSAEGLLVRLQRGIYRSAGSTPTWDEAVRVAWLSTDPSLTAEDRLRAGPPSTVIGGHTATFLHGIGNLQPEPFIFVTSARHQSRQSQIRFRMRDIAVNEMSLVGGLPVSTVEQTLAELVRCREDESLVTDCLRDAVHAGKVNTARLSNALGPLAARNGYQKDDGASFAAFMLDAI